MYIDIQNKGDYYNLVLSCKYWNGTTRLDIFLKWYGFSINLENHRCRFC